MKTIQRLIAVAVLASGVLLAQGPAGRLDGKKLEFIVNYLGLTETQQAQARELFEKAREAAQPVVAELKTTRPAMVEAVKAGKSDPIQALSARIGTLAGQLIAIHAEALAKFYNSLTPDQQAKAAMLREFVHPRFRLGGH